MTEEIPNYIQPILSDIIIEQDFQKYEIKVGSGQSEGDGFSSIMLRLSISGIKSDGKSAVLALICKILPNDQNILDKFYVVNRFEREIYFYNRILPEFEKIQHENGIFDRSDGFYAYPKCYYANFDHDNNHAVVILEDLIDVGYKMHGSTDFIVRDIEQANKLAIELGRFHAISFALRKLKPDVWKEFMGLNDLLTIMMSTDFMTSLAVKNINLALSVIDPDDTVKKQELKNLENDMWAKISKLTDSKISEPFSVINHGDCWFNNIMYLYNVSDYITIFNDLVL